MKETKGKKRNERNKMKDGSANYLTECKIYYQTTNVERETDKYRNLQLSSHGFHTCIGLKIMWSRLNHWLIHFIGSLGKTLFS